ncbi:putative U1 zinc finger [Lyophyllum shimeji]|uniref:U1 zinc finger n=1 Tax=Lyophyllum shimeji TaxID=47721 RepID=A0A9P3PL45_LYOSH|nr:putative U1 zinc finger [Lyophyllum shimeji]
MSEYWVSKKKYFCKYCEIYIADDAPSRQQHENGLRHKGNLERFIRGIYKTSEKRRKDLEEEKRDMARVDQAAQAAYAQDVAAGRAKPGLIPVASTSSAAAKKPALKPSNPWANYSTAASLGYQDPDAERAAAEAERRRTQGLAGEWQVVATISPPTAPEPEDELDENDKKPVIADAGERTGVKREAEQPPAEEDARQFKLRKRTWGAGLGEVYDPGVIPIKLKKKKEPETPPVPAESASTSASAANLTSTSTDTLKPTDSLKWTKVQWKRAGDVVKEEPQEPPVTLASLDGVVATRTEVKTEKPPAQLPTPAPVKTESDSLIPPLEETKADIPKTEESSPTLLTTEPLPTSGMFRKRKVPVNVGGSRGRRPPPQDD